jgi:surface polysaccharide O-acyltransferase-like enzyme
MDHLKTKGFWKSQRDFGNRRGISYHITSFAWYINHLYTADGTFYHVFYWVYGYAFVQAFRHHGHLESGSTAHVFFINVGTYVPCCSSLTMEGHHRPFVVTTDHEWLLDASIIRESSHKGI